MRRFGLPKTGDIVFLAFHRHQRNAGDFGRVDQLAAMGHLALGQGMLDEYGVDRLQIILCGEVQDGEKYVI